MSTDFRYYGAFLIGLCEGFVGMQGRPDTVTSWTTNSRHVLRDSARDISTFDLWYISEQANSDFPREPGETGKETSKYRQTSVEDMINIRKIPPLTDRANNERTKDGTGVLIGLLGGGILVCLIVWATTRRYR